MFFCLRLFIYQQNSTIVCGIFAYVGQQRSAEELLPDYQRIQHRGPDYSEFRAVAPHVQFGFHRLSINGLNSESNQPMHLQDCWLIANAEIYNYQQLASANQFELQTDSDCEVIIHMYRKYGMAEAVKQLDAEFAFCLYDERSGEFFAARDHLGVRGMYMGRSGDGRELGFASEAKALVAFDKLEQFPPAHWWSSSSPDTFHTWYVHEYPIHTTEESEEMFARIRELLIDAVVKRMMSDRPVGALLSGGLDSSLVSAIANKYRKGADPIETFSVGMDGSMDLIRAREVAHHIGSKHHDVVLTEKDFLGALDETIYTVGSYDVTTIRASVGHMLISHYVRDNSDVKVLYTGETIDEMGSYLYFQAAPSPEAFQAEAVRLLTDIHYFDMLRGDRSISSAGLEGRVPFSDQAFLAYYMGIDPKIRMFDDQRIEKYPLRKAFEKDNLLPDSVLWRRKNGFSDSVSSRTRSWHHIIQEYVDTVVSDTEYQTHKNDFALNPPQTKEAYYFRKKFTEFYGPHQNLTPYQWLPRWCGDIVDPSARALQMYAAD
jgi:asparagine synthase (glutamine-hydrolysing)